MSIVAPLVSVLGIVLFLASAMVIRTGPFFWPALGLAMICLVAGAAMGSLLIMNHQAMPGVIALMFAVAGLMILGHPFVSRR